MIHYETKAVAFIDLLGFKSIVCAAETDPNALIKVQEVVTLLNTTVPNLNQGIDPIVPIEVIPKHTYFSDSIVLSAPLCFTSEKGKKYDGLSSVVMRSIQIFHTLLRSKYLVRGGITIGSAWHDPNNIVGPAFIRALKLEEMASYPRIMLSNEAYEHWEKNISEYNSMCYVYEGVSMVNVLHEYFIENRDQHGALESIYRLYDETIKQSLLDPDLKDGPRQKWKWFQKYFQYERDRLGYLPPAS